MTDPQTHLTPDDEITCHGYYDGAQVFENGRRSAALVAPMSRLVQAVHGHPSWQSCRGEATGCVRIHPDLSERPLGMEPDAPRPSPPIPEDPAPIPTPEAPAAPPADLAASWPAIGHELPIPDLDPMGYGDGSPTVL